MVRRPTGDAVFALRDVAVVAAAIREHADARHPAQSLAVAVNVVVVDARHI